MVGGFTTTGSGTTGTPLAVAVEPGALPAGTYVDYINIVGAGSSSATPVQVYMVVANAAQTYNFAYTIGGAMPPSQTTPMSTSACGVPSNLVQIGYSSNGNWLTGSLNQSGTGFTITLSANPTGLAAGTYDGEVAMTDTGGEVSVVHAILTVTPAAAVATQTQLAVSPKVATTGELVTLTATVTPAAATGMVSFFDGATPLFTASLSSGTAVTVNTFAAGSHFFTAVYAGNTTYATSTSAPVTLQVTGASTATTTVLTAPSSATAGSAVVLSAAVSPSTATGSVTFLDGSNTIGTGTLTSGVATYSTSTLAAGSHTLTASYGGDANDAASTSAAVTVTITTASNAPSILVGGVLNAASYAKTGAVGSPVAPGTLVAIFTSPLSATAASFSTTTLPPALGGVSLTFNGVTAPIVQVVPNGAYPFVSAQVPFEVMPGTAQVVLTVNGVSSAPASTPIVASSPGIFTLNAEGTGQAVLVNLADYTIAAPTSAGSTAHPIPRGQSAFFYVTGLGATSPTVTDGSGTCPASSGLCNATAVPTVYIGGVKTATPAYAGQAPGFPGVSQINVTIPGNAPTGSAVVITVVSADGTVISNCGAINPSPATSCATIAVQ